MYFLKVCLCVHTSVYLLKQLAMNKEMEVTGGQIGRQRMGV